MSRAYEMQIEVRGYDPKKTKQILKACQKEWNFDKSGLYFYNSDDSDRSFEWHGEGNLCGGEGEDEFAERLTKAIRKANGAKCFVEVTAVYLENPPAESYTYEEGSDERT